MFIAILISLSLVSASALIHYEILGAINSRLGKLTMIPARMRVLVAVLGASVSHFLQIMLFAAAYFLLRDRLELGTFLGEFKDSFPTFLYFSAETYTTLGLGDIYPTGALRMLTGIEALTGLLMLGWTASFTYLEMNKYWTLSPGGAR